MLITGKSFQRRPWDHSDNLLIKHFDGINVTDVDDKGMYICMHSGAGFLKQSNIECILKEGFYWPLCIIENFIISGIRNNPGIYINDGYVPGDIKLEIAIKNGRIDNITDGNSIEILDQNLKSLCFDTVILFNPIKIMNSKIETLKIVNMPGVSVIIRNTQISRVELWNSAKVQFDGLTVNPIVNENAPLKNVKASLAANISIDGVIYQAQVPNLEFKAKI